MTNGGVGDFVISTNLISFAAEGEEEEEEEFFGCSVPE